MLTNQPKFLKDFFNRISSTTLLLGLLVGLLPFGGKPVVWTILALIVDFFLTKSYRNLKGLFQLKQPLLWSILYYCCLAVGLFWTANFKSGCFELEQKLTFILFPILIYSAKDRIANQLYWIAGSFIFGNLLACILAIGIGFYCKHLQHFSYVNPDGWLPYYNEFSPFLHVTYWSVYLSLAILLVLQWIEKSKSNLIRMSAFCILLIFTISLYYLSSKGAWFAFGIVLVMYWIKIISSNQAIRWFGIGAFVLLTTGAIWVLKNNPRIVFIKQMVYDLQHSENINPEYSSDQNNGQRIYSLKASIHVIQRHPLIGVGTGDAEDSLLAEYATMKLEALYHKKLNSHNQFATTTLQLGLIGFVSLVGFFFILFFQGFLWKQFTLIGFVAIVGINCLFESMLNAQAGIVFFALFYSLLNMFPNFSICQIKTE